MEIATPGKESATSLRLAANAPAVPAASATMRSRRGGETRATICELLWKSMIWTARAPSNHANATTPTAPATTSRNERQARLGSPITIAAVVARIGVIKGAMIIAPMTVAVESSITPFAAITVDRKSSTVNRTRYRRRRSPSKKSLLSSSGTSSGS